jgi:hypothetical protein
MTGRLDRKRASPSASDLTVEAVCPVLVIAEG